MNIIPFAEKSKECVWVSKTALKDGGLSLGAKGLLSLGMAIQEEFDFQVTREILMSVSEKDKGFQIKKYMQELESKGYAHYKVSSDGRVKTTLTFYDFPLGESYRSNRTNWKKNHPSQLPLAKLKQS
jgi:hypothetical protein